MIVRRAASSDRAEHGRMRAALWPDEAPEDGPVPDFLRLFVPALDDCLFGPPPERRTEAP